MKASPPPRLRLSLMPDRFAVCRLGAQDAAPAIAPGAPFMSITRTRDELSVVCVEEQAPPGSRIEKGYRCFAVAGPLSFSATGIVAALVAPLAEARIPVLVVATFDTDYLLVPGSRVDEASEALVRAGHDVG